ncbi:MAG: flagellar basal body P-ring protein FlgI [Pseudomonadota bacterium]|nr:flagellar basal body P-ring protein FlgI [Pseudomonadota bacterium]
MMVLPTLLFRRLALLLLLGACLAPAHAERIKDLATVQGVRPNQLVGYGLVIGLDGTGDMTTQTPFTVQSLLTMLGQLGVNLPPATSLQLKNVAAVAVTAELPAFARPGQRVDVVVGSIGNATSLRGGTLLLTALRGIDGQVYALAQGNLVIGGAGASAGGSKAQVNQLSAGRIAGGATVEREVPTRLANNGVIHLELQDTDFGTARLVEQAINKRFEDGTARALDGRSIEVRSPPTEEERVHFIADLEDLPVTPAQGAARVVVNARSGAVVMNQNVMLDPCAVAQGNLSVTINTDPSVSQPNALSNGTTQDTSKSTIDIRKDGGALFNLKGSASLGEVVKALNSLGATPQDLISILEAMKAAGALHANLEII